MASNMASTPEEPLEERLKKMILSNVRHVNDGASQDSSHSSPSIPPSRHVHASQQRHRQGHGNRARTTTQPMARNGPMTPANHPADVSTPNRASRQSAPVPASHQRNTHANHNHVPHQHHGASPMAQPGTSPQSVSRGANFNNTSVNTSQHHLQQSPLQPPTAPSEHSGPRIMHRAHPQRSQTHSQSAMTPPGLSLHSSKPSNEFHPSSPSPMEQVHRQCSYLDRVGAEEVRQAEMTPEELAEKEAFRHELEKICQDAFLRVLKQDKAGIELQAFGSVQSGFATQGSDMDLAVVSTEPGAYTPENAKTGPFGKEVPRLLEEAILNAGYGARLLANTRVPIIKVCQKPTDELRQALIDARKSWDALNEDEKYAGAKPKDHEDGQQQNTESQEQSKATQEGTEKVADQTNQTTSSIDSTPSTVDLKKRTLRIKGITGTTTEEHLKEAFQGYQVENYTIERTRDGRPIGTALINLVNESEAQRALSKLNGHLVHGHKISISFVKRLRLPDSDEGQSTESNNSDTPVKSTTQNAEQENAGQSSAESTENVTDDGPLELDGSLATTNSQLYVGNLAPDVTEVHLQTFFKDYNTLSITFPPGSNTKRHRGFAFVELTDIAEAQRALSELNGQSIMDRVVAIKSSHRAAKKAGSDEEKQEDSGGASGVPSEPPTDPKTPQKQMIVTNPEAQKQDSATDQLSPRKEKKWLREQELGPLDFPKTGVGIQCDINFSNPLGIHNTHLLRCYSACDGRIRPFVLFIKAWAKRRLINSPRNGTLSSYGFVLMVLHYLVNIARPPVAPNLQLAWRRGMPGETEFLGYDVRFWRDEAQIRQQAAAGKLTWNHDHLAVLVRGFFQYYATNSGFNWTREVLSLRSPGGLKSKQQKGWTGATTTQVDGREVRQRYLFAIEDPFETEHNVARTVTHNGIVALRDELRRAWRIITTIGLGKEPEGELFDDGLNDAPLSIGASRHGVFKIPVASSTGSPVTATPTKTDADNTAHELSAPVMPSISSSAAATAPVDAGVSRGPGSANTASFLASAAVSADNDSDSALPATPTRPRQQRAPRAKNKAVSTSGGSLGDEAGDNSGGSGAGRAKKGND